MWKAINFDQAGVDILPIDLVTLDTWCLFPSTISDISKAKTTNFNNILREYLEENLLYEGI